MRSQVVILVFGLFATAPLQAAKICVIYLTPPTASAEPAKYKLPPWSEAAAIRPDGTLAVALPSETRFGDQTYPHQGDPNFPERFELTATGMLLRSRLGAGPAILIDPSGVAIVAERQGFAYLGRASNDSVFAFRDSGKLVLVTPDGLQLRSGIAVGEQVAFLKKRGRGLFAVYEEEGVSARYRETVIDQITFGPGGFSRRRVGKLDFGSPAFVASPNGTFAAATHHINRSEFLTLSPKGGGLSPSVVSVQRGWEVYRVAITDRGTAAVVVGNNDVARSFKILFFTPGATEPSGLEIPVRANELKYLQFSPDGANLVWATETGVFRAKTEDGAVQKLGRRRADVTGLSFAADGTLQASWATRERAADALYVWDLNPAPEILGRR